MIIDEKIIDQYTELHERIENLFSEYKLEKKFYAEKIGMSRQTFARKLKDKTFLAAEMKRLADLINKIKA